MSVLQLADVRSFCDS